MLATAVRKLNRFGENEEQGKRMRAERCTPGGRNNRKDSAGMIAAIAKAGG
jgi:hypothetical protein